MQANHDFLSPMHQSMVHVEIVLISKHQFYLQLPDDVFGERGKEEGEGNHSLGRKGIFRQQRNKKASPKSMLLLLFNSFCCFSLASMSAFQGSASTGTLMSQFVVKEIVWHFRQ